MSELDDLLNEYLALSYHPGRDMDKARYNRFNKLKELIGEAGAGIEVSKTYGSNRLRHVSVPRRGTDGVYVFDILYELGDGDLVLVEAKYADARLGRTVDRHNYRVHPDGRMTSLPYKRQIEQLHAMWIEDRIEEIRKTNPALAERLDQARNNQRLKVLEVRTDVVIDSARTPQLSTTITDHTERFNEQNKSRGRPNDDERKAARREALGQESLKESEKKARKNKDAAERAKKKSVQADGHVEKAKQELKNAEQNPRTRATTRAKRKADLAEKEEIAKQLKQKAKDAEEVAKRSEEISEFHRERTALDTKKREGEEVRKRFQSSRATTATGTASASASASAPAPAPAPASQAVTPTAGDKPPQKARPTTAATQTAGKALADPMIEQRALGGALAAETKVSVKVAARSATQEVAQVAKAASKRGIYRFAAKGAEVVVKVGRFAFAVLNFANPVFDLLAAVDLVDSLVNWLQREKIEDKQEWLRISDFLYGPNERIVTPYGIGYQTSIRDIVNAFLEVQLANDAYDRNFLYWLNKWNADRAWKGFVYTQAIIELERQKQTNSDEKYNVKYYMESAPEISFVDNPLSNSRKATFPVTVGPQDEKNRSTGGGPARYESQYNIVVEISYLKVRFTHSRPTLTPFDFIIVKCRSLVAEIVTFISNYDENIIDGMNVRDEILDNVKINWLERYPFRAPLNGEQIHFCLNALFFAIDGLSAHAIRENDFKTKERNRKFNIGFDRRLEILRQLSRPRGRESIGTRQHDYKGKRLLYAVAVELGNITTVKNRMSRAAKDLHYLRELALSIDGDLMRAFNNCRTSPGSLEYNYQGKPAK